MFAPFRLGLQRVEGEYRVASRKDTVYECCPVSVDARHLTDSLRQSFWCLKNGVKRVVLHELSFAVLEDFEMDTPSLELTLNRVSPSLSFGESRCRWAVPESAISPILKPRQCQDRVELGAMCFKIMVPTYEASWREE